MRHPEETKQSALESMARIGAKKTHEATGISMQTLYKWRNEQRETSPPADKKVQAAKELLKDDGYLQDKVAQLEAENAKLRSANEKLKAALLAFIE